MLTELYIKDFAIIDELRLRLGAGLNVLTGETGAGKSIIVDALGAALGQRVGAEVVRTGAPQAVVEAVYELGDGQNCVGELLSEHGLEAEDAVLILSREINRSTGRTTARVNSRSIPLSLLQQLGERLVDIHGQSQHLSLLRVREHLEYLDRYAGLSGLRTELSASVTELKAIRADLDRMVRDERESAREVDLLSYQIQEIRGAELSADEEEKLMAERVRLRNAERLRELAHAIHELLDGGEDRSGVVDLLAQADRLYLELARYDPEQEGDRQSLESARYAIQEVEQSVRAYAESAEDDPDRQNEVEERLELITRLKRKYGSTLPDVLSYCEEAEAKLEKLSNRAFYLDELRRSENELIGRVGRVASRLSGSRKEAALRLAEEVQGELAELNMGGTRFDVAFSMAPDPDGVPYDPADGAPDPRQRVAFDSTGIDRVEFLVSPNPGEEPKSLAKIASGGETARLMLALKTILSKADAIPTLVFDEIDVGVGARSGLRVGEKLWRLTDCHQVVCITHMPQVACMADLHLSVAKQVESGRTRTAVSALEGGRRVEELAAMLSGSSEMAAAVASAEELLRRAQETKAAGRRG